MKAGGERLRGASEAGAGCARGADVAAYLDRELADAASASFEGHARSCRACAHALNEQKRLLCLLDAALLVAPDGGGGSGGARPPARRDAASPPRDFARIVSARARTDMGRTLRGAPERRRAALLCALLFAASAVCLSLSSTVVSLSPVWRALRAVSGVAGVTTGALHDAATGAAVVLRSLGGHLVPAPASSGASVAAALVWFLAACLCAALLRRVFAAHRRGRV